MRIKSEVTRKLFIAPPSILGFPGPPCQIGYFNNSLNSAILKKMKLIALILRNYKIKLLISLTVTIVIIALRVEKNLLNMFLILSGTILASFILDMEYFAYAYLTAPAAEFSLGLKELVKNKNYLNLIEYINAHKYGIEKRTLHSILFQLALALLLLAVSVPNERVFGLSLALCTLVQTFYEMYEDSQRIGTVQNWFWILKSTPSKTVITSYLLAMGLFFVYILRVIA